MLSAHGVPRRSRRGTVVIMAPESMTALGSSGLMMTSWVWVRASYWLSSGRPSLGGDCGEGVEMERGDDCVGGVAVAWVLVRGRYGLIGALLLAP